MKAHSSAAKRMEEEDAGPSIDVEEVNRQISRNRAEAERDVSESITLFKKKSYSACSNLLSRALHQLQIAQVLVEKRDAALKKSPVKMHRSSVVSSPTSVQGGGSDPTSLVTTAVVADKTAMSKRNEIDEINEKTSYILFKRAQCSRHLQSFHAAVSDCTSAISLDPNSPYIGMYFLLKGVSLGCLGQHADASSTYLQGLKVTPYDQSLREHFNQSVLSMKQQYHSFATTKREDSARQRGIDARPEKGFRDRHMNSLLSRVSSSLPVSSLIQEEVTFWAMYGVYLAKKELKEEMFKVIVAYKGVLKGIFERFCKDSRREIIKQPAKKVLRRPTFKDAAKMVLQRERRRSSISKTANGLRPETSSDFMKVSSGEQRGELGAERGRQLRPRFLHDNTTSRATRCARHRAKRLLRPSRPRLNTLRSCLSS